jgi:hypothetical protein
MDYTLIKDMATILAALAAILGLFQYVKYRSRRDKMATIGDAFSSVINSLASKTEVERLAAAIRLRRFFDPETEFGIAGTPYASEAINVIAAVLRTQKAGSFQKLLADGLAYAPTLCRADLQRTNLQKAYLGTKPRNEGTIEHGRVVGAFQHVKLYLGFGRRTESTEDERVNLSQADFYRADLSGASLKGAKAQNAVFYRARLHNSVLSEANLSDANFYGADLTGAKFDDANLTGAKFDDAVLTRASFRKARNVPPELAEKLDDRGKYSDDLQPFKSASGSQKAALKRVFLSKPGLLDDEQRQFIDSIISMLDKQNFVSEVLERSEYPKSGTLAEVRRLIGGCNGIIIFGFHQLNVQNGTWRPGTVEETPITDMYLSTPWNQIEAGMAVMRGLPILLVCPPAVADGIFKLDNDRHIFRVALPIDENPGSFEKRFAEWCDAVRELARVG